MRPVLNTEGNHDGPIKLESLAPGVAREEDARLALRDVVHIQDLFSVVTERLGRYGIQAVKAEECRDEQDDGDKSVPKPFFASMTPLTRGIRIRCF